MPIPDQVAVTAIGVGVIQRFGIGELDGRAAPARYVQFGIGGDHRIAPHQDFGAGACGHGDGTGREALRARQIAAHHAARRDRRIPLRRQRIGDQCAAHCLRRRHGIFPASALRRCGPVPVGLGRIDDLRRAGDVIALARHLGAAIAGGMTGIDFHPPARRGGGDITADQAKSQPGALPCDGRDLRRQCAGGRQRLARLGGGLFAHEVPHGGGDHIGAGTQVRRQVD